MFAQAYRRAYRRCIGGYRLSTPQDNPKQAEHTHGMVKAPAISCSMVRQTTT